MWKCRAGFLSLRSLGIVDGTALSCDERPVHGGVWTRIFGLYSLDSDGTLHPIVWQFMPPDITEWSLEGKISPLCFKNH